MWPAPARRRRSGPWPRSRASAATRCARCAGSSASHVTMATANTHVGRLLAKLAARDRAQLVMVAYETGLVQPG